MRQRIGRYKIDVLWLAGFLFLPLLLYGGVTIGSQTMIPADNLFQWQPWASAADELGVGSPHNPLISDLLIQNYAWKQFINDNVREGQIPLWSPALFGGAPFLATGQNAAYYPFSVLFLILPLTKAYGWYTVSQLWLAGALMYVFGRVLGLRRESAFLAGLVYQGCGFMLVSAAVFPMIIGAAAWLPFLLACIVRVVQRSSSRNLQGSGKVSGRALPWVVVGAIGLGCQLLAGHVEITYYTLLVMAALAGWLLVGVWVREGFRRVLAPAGFLISLVILGLMLGAIQFVPLYEVAQSNFREGSASLEQVRDWGFPPRRVLTLALPNFYGNPTHHTYRDVFTGEVAPFTLNAYGEVNPNGAESSDWGIKNYVEGGVYLGILPLVMAVVGGLTWFKHRQRRSQILFFLTLSGFSLSFIFGTPLYAILYYGLPGINQLHSPFRWVFPLSLCVAALAGYGLDWLMLVGRGTEDEGRKGAVPSVFRLPAFVILGGGGAILLGLLGSRLLYGSLEPIIERVFMGLAKAPEAFADTSAFYNYLFWQVGWLGLMLLVTGGLLWVSGRGDVVERFAKSFGRFNKSPYRAVLGKGWVFVALVVVGVDLWFVGRGFNASADPALLDYKPELVSWLEDQPGRWRLTTFTPHGDKPFNANVGWYYNFEDVRGYDSIIPKQYTTYMAAIEPQNELQFNRIQPIVNWESLNSPLLDMLGVKFIITSEQIELPKLQQVWQGEGLFVYENLAVSPRAVVLPQSATVVTDDVLGGMTERDPRQFVFVEQGLGIGERGAVAGVAQVAEIRAYGNIEVTVEAKAGESSWLVLHDSFAPEWKAFVRPAGDDTVDESEITIYRVNGNFRGVQLEPGEWSIRFRYSPLTFRVGGLTSAMGGIIILFIVAVWFWQRFYNPQAELTNTRSIAKNSAVPTVLNLLNRGIDFLFAAFYLRVLGPADNGSYATAIAIAGWFEIISNFGLNTLIIRDVSQDRSQASHYLLNTTILRIATTIVGALPIFIYVGLVSQGDNPLSPDIVLAIALIMVGMIFSGVGQSFTGLFYAHETAETPAAVATITTILKVGLGVLVLLLGQSYVGLAGVSIVVNVITLLILAWLGFRQFALNGPWRVDFPLQRQMVVKSYPLMLNHLLATIFFFIDVPLMRQINGEEAVGWYNTAYKWINAINVIPSFFTFALFPVISRQIQSDMNGAMRTFRMAVKLMVLIALPISAVTMLLAPTLVLVLGGEAFLPDGAIALQIVIWSIPFGWINSVTNYVLIALGKERAQVWAFLAGVTFNFVANLVLLPTMSYRGAALTTILSEVILLALFSLYLRDRMPNVGWVKLLARPVLVTAVMGGAMAIGLQIHLVVGLLLGVVAYPAGLWLLGVFGEEEKNILRSLLPERVANRLPLAES